MIKKFILQTPYIPLGFSILIVWIIAFIKKGYVIDLRIYDTYYMVPIYLIASAFTFILMFGIILYWFSNKEVLVKLLTNIHVLGTVLIVVYLMSTVGYPANSQIAMDIPLSIAEYRKLEQMKSQFVFGSLLLGLLQILLLINFIIGIAINSKRRL